MLQELGKIHAENISGVWRDQLMKSGDSLIDLQEHVRDTPIGSFSPEFLPRLGLPRATGEQLG